MDERETQLTNMIKALEDKDFNLYFFVLDTKGNPTAGVANIYEHVKVLSELGYKAHILHEKNDYFGVTGWLGAEYAKLSHVSIEGGALNINTTDFIIIPEIFATIMDQVKAFPCKKVVFSQSYHYILELLQIGKRWDVDYGFKDVLTTSEKQANYIKRLFPSVTTHVTPVSVPKYFKPNTQPKKPIITISTRDQADALKIVKSFYLQYPRYKWLTFRELRGIPKETLAKDLAESCLCVWVDNIAGFGTIPLEAIECETPVVGLLPNLIPEWMEEEVNGEKTLKTTGVWTNNILNIPELIAVYMDYWLNENVPQEISTSIEKAKGAYSEENQKNKIAEVFNNMVESRKKEFQAILELKPNE